MESNPPPAGPLIPALGVLGSLVLAAGVFSPVLLPPGGEPPISYRDYDPVSGNAVLGLAAVSFVLTWVFGWYRGLAVTGGLAVVMAGLPYLRTGREVAVGTFAGATWGWLVLLAGAALLLMAAGLAESQRRRTQEDQPPEEEDTDASL